jgi:hypothetical protein
MKNPNVSIKEKRPHFKETSKRMTTTEHPRIDNTKKKTMADEREIVKIRKLMHMQSGHFGGENPEAGSCRNGERKAYEKFGVGDVGPEGGSDPLLDDEPASEIDSRSLLLLLEDLPLHSC